MHKKSLLEKASDLFSKIVIAVYVYFRGRPSTKIFDISLPSEHQKDFLRLGGKPKWKAVMTIDRAIEHLEKTYGITKFQTVALYDIDTAYELNKIYELIVLGVVKPGDYTSDKPVSKCVRYEMEILSSNPNYKKIENAPEWKDLARQNTTDRKEYWYLHSSIVQYEYDRYKTRRATERIEESLRLYGTETYGGKNLYAIEDLNDLWEALDAIELMHHLRNCWFVISFKGKPLEELTGFALESCLQAVERKDNTGIVYDEVKKAGYDELERLEEISDAKKEKRNAAARDRRARKKAEQRTAAGKAAETKPSLKVIKTAAGPTGPKKAAPVKKAQPKKAVDKKAS